MLLTHTFEISKEKKDFKEIRQTEWTGVSTFLVYTFYLCHLKIFQKKNSYTQKW